MDCGKFENDNAEVCQKKFKRSVLRQVTLGLVANFSTVAPSMSLGFSAVALPPLTNPSDPFSLTPTQASWFASIAALAIPFGCLLSGPIADSFGRKRAIFCVNLFTLIGWLTIALSSFLSFYPILLLGRLLTGFATGLASIPASIYMAEISSPKLRGVFCSWTSVSFALGVLLIYIFGLFFKDNWNLVALTAASLPCLSFVLVSFLLPESPSWLIRKGKIDEAERSMCKIFGVKTCTPQVQTEIEVLLKSKGTKETKTIKQKFLRKIQNLSRKSNLKPLALIVTFFFFQQFSGTFSIVFYAIDIVQNAGIKIDPYFTIVLIAFVRVVATICSSYICKNFGRRPLSIISGSGMTFCMFCLSAYIYFKFSFQALPVILLLSYFLISSLGFLPIPFTMSAEVFPGNIRGVAVGVASACGYFFNFVAVKSYPMMEGFGGFAVFLFYGLVALVGTVFVALMLPETRGRSLEEIEEYFGGKEKKALLNKDLTVI